MMMQQQQQKKVNKLMEVIQERGVSSKHFLS